MKKFIYEYRETIKIILFCFFISLLILLFTSKGSPLYPINDWVDANAFFSVGKAWFNGMIPYLDLFEQKGPLLYLIYGIGYLFSHTSFLGVFILEVLFWVISLYYNSKIIDLFLPRKYSYLILPIYMCLICISTSFTHGGGAEEFCLPFFSITLYYFFKNFKEKEISYKELFISGLCAGSILLIKYTLLGFWFGFMACLFFWLLGKKKIKKAICACLVFLLGMFSPVILFLIYFGLHGAIKDFIHVYFTINITAYSGSSSSILSRLYTIYTGFIGTSFNNGIISFILLVLFPGLTLFLKIDKKAKISLIMIYLLSILGIFWGLKFYRYYLFPMQIFTLVSLIAIANFISKYFVLKRNFLIYLSVLICILLSFYKANYKEFRFVKKSDLFQYKFADIINKEENPTLVNMGYLDCGVYTASGVVPSTYFFEKQNIPYENFPDNLDSFKDYINNKTTMFIVYFTKNDLEKLKENEETLFFNYDLVSHEEQDFEHELYQAYLFRRKEG